MMKAIRRLLLGTVVLLGLMASYLLYHPIRTVLSFQQMENLYTMNYSGRYSYLSRFVPQIKETPDASDDNRQASTLFAAVGDETHPMLGQDRQVASASAPLVLYTDPPNGYASVSVVDMNELGLGLESKINLLERQFMLLLAPLMATEGMNEHGVAIAKTDLPAAEPSNPTREENAAIRAMLRGVLDHAQTTQDAVELLAEYNLTFRLNSGHFLIADASGDSVVVCFVNGEMEVLRDEHSWPMAAESRLARLDEEMWGMRARKAAVDDQPGQSADIAAEESENVIQQEAERGKEWSTLFNLHTGDIIIATGGEYDELYRINIRPSERNASKNVDP